MVGWATSGIRPRCAGCTREPIPLTRSALHDRLLAATYRCVERFGLGQDDDRRRRQGVGGLAGDDLPAVPGRARRAVARDGRVGAGQLLQPRSPTRCATRPNLAELLEQGLVLRAPVGDRARGAPQDPRHRARAAAAAADDRVGQDAAVHRRLPAPVPAPGGRGRPARGPASTSTGRPSTSPAAILSLIDAPGRWDLDDPAQVADLVDDELLGGIDRRRPPERPAGPLRGGSCVGDRAAVLATAATTPLRRGRICSGTVSVWSWRSRARSMLARGADARTR